MVNFNYIFLPPSTNFFICHSHLSLDCSSISLVVFAFLFVYLGVCVCVYVVGFVVWLLFYTRYWSSNTLMLSVRSA